MTQNYCKQRPVHYECIDDNKKNDKMLISRNVDLENKNMRYPRPIHIACMHNHNFSCNNIDMIKLLVDGFISDKIYATKSLVNLDRLSKDLHLLNMASDKKVSEFIFKKIEAINRTLFIKIEKNYSDVRFI